MAIAQLHDPASFEDLIAGPVPTLVKFTAPWCGPCKAVAPAVDELSGLMQGRMEILEVDIDEFSDLPSRYGVQSVPTFLLFEEGEVLTRIVGGRTATQFVNALEPLL